MKRKKVFGSRADSDHGEFTQQDKASRRLVRSEYVTIMNVIRDTRDAISSADSDDFKFVMSAVEDLHHLVQKPREQVADAEALLDLAKTLLSSVRCHSRGDVTPADFISCLLRDFTKRQRRVGTSDFIVCWKDIGVAVSPIFKSFRGCCTMLGPMQTELKPRKAAVWLKLRKAAVCRRRAKRTSCRTQPEQIANTEAEEKADTDKNMLTMFEILKKKKRVKVESLILDRVSFAQTVENLFALSFLVKDGRVEMAEDENGSHLVSPRNAPAANSIMSGEVTYSHFVFRYDFNDWKWMMDFVGVGEELMPHRGSPPVKEPSRNGLSVVVQKLEQDDQSSLPVETANASNVFPGPGGCKRKLRCFDQTY